MSKKTENILIRVTPKEKEFIKNKSNEYNYRSTSAFLIESAKNHFILELDMSVYRELAKEINYIGKNINNLVKHVFTVGVISNTDIDYIKRNQEIIIEKLNKEYDHLLMLRKKYASSNMSLKDKKRLASELSKHEIEIPKKIVLEELYDSIRSDIIYLCEMIDISPLQEEGISDFVWEYLYGDTLFSLDESKVINFADDIFMLVQKLKTKFIKPNIYFDDDDWWELKDILDKYEV